MSERRTLDRPPHPGRAHRLARADHGRNRPRPGSGHPRDRRTAPERRRRSVPRRLHPPGRRVGERRRRARRPDPDRHPRRALVLDAGDHPGDLGLADPRDLLRGARRRPRRLGRGVRADVLPRRRHGAGNERRGGHAGRASRGSCSSEGHAGRGRLDPEHGRDLRPQRRRRRVVRPRCRRASRREQALEDGRDRPDRAERRSPAGRRERHARSRSATVDHHRCPISRGAPIDERALAPGAAFLHGSSTRTSPSSSSGSGSR